MVNFIMMQKNGKIMSKYISRTSISIQNEKFLINGKPLHDHEKHKFLTVEDILVHSSNIGISNFCIRFLR